MAEEQVEVIHAQAPERIVAGVVHVLARQAALRRPRPVHRSEEHLARHAPRIARQAEVGERIAHHAFGFAVGVGLGVVEEVDAVVVGGGEQFARFPAPHLLAEGDPGAEGERGQLEARRAEAAVLHARVLAC